MSSLDMQQSTQNLLHRIQKSFYLRGQVYGLTNLVHVVLVLLFSISLVIEGCTLVTDVDFGNMTPILGVYRFYLGHPDT